MPHRVSTYLAGIAIVVMASGSCARAVPPSAPSGPVAPDASPPPVAAPARPALPATPPVITQPRSVTEAAFTPSAAHSPILDPGTDITADSIHRYRGGDALPPLEAVSPVLGRAKRLAIVAGALRVRTAPNAEVAAWAAALGSFAAGRRGVVVRADATGLAVIDVKLGVDGGDYAFYLASPARSGLVIVSLSAE